eukprot:1160641-Pelagomonas_calceolata.AAC.16
MTGRKIRVCAPVRCVCFFARNGQARQMIVGVPPDETCGIPATWVTVRLKRARQATGTRKRLLVIEAGGYTVTRGYSEIEVAARPIHAGPAARIEGCTTAGARRAASWQAEIAPSQAEGHTSVFHMLQCPRHA